jgi:hypothetical protein
MINVDTALAFSQARIIPVTSFRRIEKLPHGAVPKVAMGQMVKAMEILAVAEIPDSRRLIDVANELRIKPAEVMAAILKRPGDVITEGESLASRSQFFGLRKRRIVSPFDGRVAWIGDGQILLEGDNQRIEVLASAPGRVTAIEPGEFITLEVSAAVVEAAWGHGGLAWGTLKLMDGTPSYSTDTGRFTIDHRGAIVAIASPLTETFVEEAIEIRVKGLIASSANASLIPTVKKAPFPIGLTQGFGQIPMSAKILAILNTHNGRELSMAMGQPSDSRKMRPEIIIPVSVAPTKQDDRDSERGEQLALRPGQRVRILQNPYMGEIGTVAEISIDPHQVSSGLWLPGAFVDIGTGRSIFVPFANLQQLG